MSTWLTEALGAALAPWAKAVGAALLAFGPWLWVLVTQHEQARYHTDCDSPPRDDFSPVVALMPSPTLRDWLGPDHRLSPAIGT